MKRHGCFCLRQGHITDEYLPYNRPIAPFGLAGYIANRDCAICGGTGYQKENKLKILFVGDAVVPTGFSKCTHAVCDRLHASGHDVTVLGICYYGDPHKYPYQIYPAINPLDYCVAPWGEQRLPLLIDRLSPDVVVIQQDAWNINGYIREIKRQLDSSRPLPVLVGWVSVDTLNHPYAKQLNDLDHVVCWTQFGIDQLLAGGMSQSHSIIPLGVDSSVFHPVDRAQARKYVSSTGTAFFPAELPDDAYVIGIVGRNQFRKRFDLALEYFTEWLKRYDIDDAYLYFYTNQTREMGADIIRIARHYGIAHRVILGETMLHHAPLDDEMKMLYNGFDLHWSVSQSEGWNLPALESMACGIPVLLPDQGGPSSWARDAACLIPCTLNATNAPVNQALFTLGGISDKCETVTALDKLYRHADYRRKLSSLGLELARSLTWDRVGEQWEGLLQSLWRAKYIPTMTDLMVSPEAIDEALKLPKHNRCEWPGCQEEALCRSGNFGGHLVCSSHFLLTNGGPEHEAEVVEALAVLR